MTAVPTTIATAITAEVIMTIKEKSPLHFRHELKHSINTAEDIEISGRLRKLFKHDENAGSHGTYCVSSLYFDTPYDKALRQKLDGVNSREKFRLRYYNGNLDFIRLEKKLKINGLCCKYSARMTAGQADQLLRGNISFLMDSENPLMAELYSKMQGQLLHPKTIVTYDREAFLYAPGNVRITLDRRLRTGLGCTDFFNPRLYHADVSEKTVILEVKYDAFLPELVRLAVQIPNRQAAAYSKYAACRRYD